MLPLLILICGQQTIDYKVLKVDVVNSQSYQFPNKFISELIPKFSKKPVVVVERENQEITEKQIGEVVCLQLNKDGWLIAKAVIDKKVPSEYVMRPIFKIEQYQLTSGCNFVVEKGEINKFVMLSPIFASSYGDK